MIRARHIHKPDEIADPAIPSGVPTRVTIQGIPFDVTSFAKGVPVWSYPQNDHINETHPSVKRLGQVTLDSSRRRDAQTIANAIERWRRGSSHGIPDELLFLVSDYLDCYDGDGANDWDAKDLIHHVSKLSEEETTRYTIVNAIINRWDREGREDGIY